jgi:hypothetical protein
LYYVSRRETIKAAEFVGYAQGYDRMQVHLRNSAGKVPLLDEGRIQLATGALQARYGPQLQAAGEFRRPPVPGPVLAERMAALAIYANR